MITQLEKACIARSAVVEMALTLRAEGDEKNAALFREISECSDRGLAALYDAVKREDVTY